MHLIQNSHGETKSLINLKSGRSCFQYASILEQKRNDVLHLMSNIEKPMRLCYI
nr:MAG TPA: hypothetical protein [Caudoviricetes sp.]